MCPVTPSSLQIVSISWHLKAKFKQRYKVSAMVLVSHSSLLRQTSSGKLQLRCLTPESWILCALPTQITKNTL